MSAELVKAAKQLASALRDFDPGLLSGEDCAAVAMQLAVVEKACAGARSLAAARAAACGAHRALGFADPVDWLARTCGSTRGDARAALEVAASIGDVPGAKEALAKGEVSLAQAKEIARAEAECTGAGADLVAFAAGRSLQTLRDEARRRRLGAGDPMALRDRQLAAREFRHCRDDIGMVCFRGAWPPEVGIPFVNRVEAECDRVRRAARRQGSAEPRTAHAADALIKLVDGGGGGRGRARAADLVIVCDLNAWRRGVAAAGEPCHLVGGGPIPVELARELSRDAFVKVVLHDGVDIHTVCHLGRHIRAELRTALDLGGPPRFDGTTCADGCGSHYGLQWDHVNPVANRGPTSFANLQARCYACHAEKTERDRRAGLLRGRGARAVRPP